MYKLWRNSSRFLPRYYRKARLSLSLFVVGLLVSPLAAWSYFPTSPQVSLEDILPHGAHNPPVPGELIVRFQLRTASILLNELRNLPYSRSDLSSTLIGRRLGVDLLKEAAPDLAATFDGYQVRSGDVIDPALGIYRLNAGREVNIYQLLLDVQRSKRVVYAEPNYPAFALQDPNDPFYRRGNQWGITKTDLPSAWEITTGSDAVTIAIVDSGVAAQNPELDGRVLPGMNFLVDPPALTTTDEFGHGTFVAGIAAARGNNGIGMVGVSWGAKILPVKVLNAYGSTSNAVVAMGINYAAEQRAQIINLSLGTPDRSQAVYDAVSKAYDQGLIMVSAAGNDGRPDPQYPAAFDQVISVGSSTPSDRAASYSNSGPDISIIAPGDGILSLTGSTLPGLNLGINSGTSFAAPFVSGTIALMLSVNKYLTNSQVKNMLEATADYPSSVPVTSSSQGSSPGPLTTFAATTQALPTPTLPSSNDSSPVYIPPIGSTPSFTTVTTTPTTPTTSATPLTQSSGFDLRFGFGRLNAYKAVVMAQRNNLFVSRRGTLNINISGNLDPQDVLVTVSPGESRVPDENGHLSFAALPPGLYRVTASSTKYGLVGLTGDFNNSSTYIYQVQGTGGETQAINFDFSAINQVMAGGYPVGAFATITSSSTSESLRYFTETGHSIRGPFKKFWEANGGLLVLGYPISEQFIEKGLRVQYFERVVCEYQPDLAGTQFEIQVRRLGSELAQSRTDAPFQKVEAPAEDVRKRDNIYYWKETGHSLRDVFLSFWLANNGQVTIGLPISEPFVEKGITVQYFEKQRLELYPDPAGKQSLVIGTLLARDSAMSRGLLGKLP